MDLKRLEKMRATCPSRKSMMDFLYNGNPPNDLEKPNTCEVGIVSSPPNDGNVAKEPLREITNIEPSLDVGVQYEVVKRNRTTAGKKNAGSVTIGHVLANSHDEGCCVAKDSETPDDSERIKLNPSAPVFVQKQAPEQQSVGSPTFEVSNQDLSDFNPEQSEPTNDGCLNQSGDVEPRAICTPYYKVTDAQSFYTPYYEIEDHQISPSYCERLDTIFEEPCRRTMVPIGSNT